MCEIFIVSGTGMMTFVEFLDMVSAFNPKVSDYIAYIHQYLYVLSHCLLSNEMVCIYSYINNS